MIRQVDGSAVIGRRAALDQQVRGLVPGHPQAPGPPPDRALGPAEAPGELEQPAAAIVGVEGVGQADGDILTRVDGEQTPVEADPTGETYCFERGARKDTGGDGWADVWKRHYFAWEYKGRRADLDAAFEQLQQYSLALENPSLLIVSDIGAVPDSAPNWTNSVQPAALRRRSRRR